MDKAKRAFMETAGWRNHAPSEEPETDDTVCMHCGGSVGASGYAEGGEVEEDTDVGPAPDDVDAKKALFAQALRGKS